jgi:hypothetical protein
MARRTFDVIDVTEILVHWYAGRSLNEMSQSLGVDRKTLRKYVAPAVAAGISPGGPAKSEAEWLELVRRWFPELVDTRLRQVTWPTIAEYHDYITAQLKAGTRMSTIHQRLRDERGLAASVASFRRYVLANIPEEVRRSRVVVYDPRQAEAGEQAQIDYGQLGRWSDPGDREAVYCLGVRHGPGVLAAHVRASGGEDGPAGVDWVSRGRLRVLRRGPGAAGSG